MPKIETFKIRVKNPERDDDLLEVPGIAFEYRGVRFFYRSDRTKATEVSHADTGVWVCREPGRHSAKAGKEALERTVQFYGWERLLSEIKARSKPI